MARQAHAWLAKPGEVPPLQLVHVGPFVGGWVQDLPGQLPPMGPLGAEARGTSAAPPAGGTAGLAAPLVFARS